MRQVPREHPNTSPFREGAFAAAVTPSPLRTGGVHLCERLRPEAVCISVTSGFAAIPRWSRVTPPEFQCAQGPEGRTHPSPRRRRPG